MKRRRNNYQAMYLLFKNHEQGEFSCQAIWHTNSTISKEGEKEILGSFVVRLG